MIFLFEANIKSAALYTRFNSSQNITIVRLSIILHMSRLCRKYHDSVRLTISFMFEQLSNDIQHR